MAKWTGFSIDWYVELFQDPVIMESFGVTISVAVLSSLIAVVIGTLAAIGINEFKKWTLNLTLNLTYVPMMNADIVTGISLLLFFIFVEFPGDTVRFSFPMWCLMFPMSSFPCCQGCGNGSQSL